MPSGALLRELRRLDRDLELVFLRGIERWVLYRVRRGLTPGGDLLTKELDLGRRPPGSWLLDWLRANDKTEGGNVDPDYAARQYLRSLDAAEERRLGDLSRRETEMAEHIGSDLYHYAVRERKHFTMKETGE